MDLSKLNKEQKEAVTTTSGPLLVVAGAGSGKTRVLTHRIAYLIEKGIKPYNILAITFTNKAAREMKERVVSLVGDIAESMQISTFHSFGLRIVRENYKKLGLDNNFTIFDSEDSLVIIKRILKEFDIDVKKFPPKSFKNRISGLKNDLVSYEEYSKYARDEFEKLLVKVYKRYTNELLNNNGVDFDDLLVMPIKLFNENKDILEYYQEKFKYILIDEYQDTNEAQYKLTRMLSAKYQNICVVGDSDQTIYGFRGANFKNILNFEKDYPLCKTIILNKNYRSTKKILDVANMVIKNNVNRYDKDLESVIEGGEPVVYYRARNGIDEIQYIINEINKIKNEASLDDIVILYRTNAQSRAFEDEFLKKNIPYRIIGSVNFYARREIKDLVAYLKILNNPRDTISLLRAINTPKRGIGTKTVEDLIRKSEETGNSIFDVIESGKALTFKNLIDELISESDNLSLTELVELVLEKSGLRQELINENTLESEIRLANLEEFKSITKAFEDKYGLISLPDFLYEVGLISDNTEITDSLNRVTLMTIHSVKGLEFDYVFVTGLEENLFPHSNCIGSDEEIEEERRLCYVAITRARKKLYLTNARTRVLYGNDQINPVSRFVNEIDEDYLAVINPEFMEIFHKAKEGIKKIVKGENLSKEEVEYQVNDFVYHDVFGAGKVLSVSGSVVKVAFKMPYGIKTLMKNHKSLRKV